MAHRSDQVAHWLAAQGVGRGDRVMLMLGNQVELWESMLAVMKLGAVIMPTTTALGPADLADRIVRGRSPPRHLPTRPTSPSSTRWPATTAGSRVGDGPAAWSDYRRAYDIAEPVRRPHPGTAPGDPLLLYFTSGTTSRPKLVEHTQVSYPVGHLQHDVLARACARATCTSTSARPAGPSTPGAASSRRGSPRRRSSSTTTPASTRRPCCDQLRTTGVHDVLRPADRLADAHPGRPVRRPRVAARGDRGRRTAQPGGHRAGASGPGG